MGNPTVGKFLRRFIKDDEEYGKYSNLELEFLTHYLADLSLIDYGCIKFLLSVVATSAVFLARFTLQPTNYPWSTKQESTGYKVSELKECVYALLELQSNKKCSTLIAIRDKYMQHSRGNEMDLKHIIRLALQPPHHLANLARKTGQCFAGTLNSAAMLEMGFAQELDKTYFSLREQI